MPLLVLLTVAGADAIDRLVVRGTWSLWSLHSAFLLVPAVILAPPLARFVTLRRRP